MCNKLARTNPLRAFMLLIVMFLVSSAYAQKVPITFDRYHGFGGTEDYLKRVSSAYPEITELLIIGKSTMDRPIYVLVISNMKSGTTIDRHVELRNIRKENVGSVSPMKTHQGKPGHFISGATHGNEYTGTEVCLYTIDKLVAGYGSDDHITELINNNAFYICPVINPDGVFNSVEKGFAQRANSALKDDDNDGKINEDGPDDLDKDGFITSFRYKDAKGTYIIDDKDPRLMIRLGNDEKTDKERYSVIREDKDNDGDGKRGEDSEGGIDLNRNYPEGWWNDQGFAGGTGDYPTSAPETHALAEFFTNYRNIIMVQFYHTSGGFTYRPMGTAPPTQMDAKDVAVFDFIMGKKYLEIIGAEVPEAWKEPDRIDELKKELASGEVDKYSKQRGYVLPRGWRASYNETDDERYGYGMASDWLYAQYGIYSLTTELWNPEADIPGFPELEEGDDRRIQVQRELLKYQDDKYKGSLFVSWKAFNHPELGEGETGGWISQYSRNNAFPGEPLIEVCEKHWQFELFRAGLLPRVTISNVKASILATTTSKEGVASKKEGNAVIKEGKALGKYNIVEVSATIENLGSLSTNLAKGASLPGNREDVAWLIGGRDNIEYIDGTPFVQLGSLDGKMKIPGFKTNNNSKEVKWIVAVKENTPLKIVVSSLKGGTVVQEVSVK